MSAFYVLTNINVGIGTFEKYKNILIPFAGPRSARPVNIHWLHKVSHFVESVFFVATRREIFAIYFTFILKSTKHKKTFVSYMEEEEGFWDFLFQKLVTIVTVSNITKLNNYI